MKQLFSMLLCGVMLIGFSACEQNNDVNGGDANGHEYVDLGLPSGTLWATCNVGATIPEEYGEHFAWGETTSKNEYGWVTYKWGEKWTLTKYCTNSYYGTVDDKLTLEIVDDAAKANWGGDWRMPTLAEQQELLNECTWNWTTLNGVNGYQVTSKNGNSIFLPAAGLRRNDSGLDFAGEYSEYWSSSLFWSTSYEENTPSEAWMLYFDIKGYDCGYNARCQGRSVRAVCSSR